MGETDAGETSDRPKVELSRSLGHHGENPTLGSRDDRLNGMDHVHGKEEYHSWMDQSFRV
jgi:hypothetical protein